MTPYAFMTDRELKHISRRSTSESLRREAQQELRRRTIDSWYHRNSSSSHRPPDYRRLTCMTPRIARMYFGGLDP